METAIKTFTENFPLKGSIVGDKYLNLPLHGSGGGDWTPVNTCNHILEDVNSLATALKECFLWCQ